MDEDENLSMLLSMGFPDIEEAQRALRAAKNDLNEAVRIMKYILLRQTIIQCKRRELAKNNCQLTDLAAAEYVGKSPWISS